MFRKLAVQITERSVVNVYTDITCSVDDRLVIETKGKCPYEGCTGQCKLAPITDQEEAKHG